MYSDYTNWWCNGYVSCSPRVWYILGSSTGRVKLKTTKLVCVASPLGTQH